MKILYSVQATGNGHIARAEELLPFLQRYGTVDVFLSGSNSTLDTTLPVKYKSKGLSLFYGNNGGLDYLKVIKAFAPLRFIREARDLPVEKYDVVLNDFESITALACKIKNVPSIHFGHQASFRSEHTPRPAKKDIVGEFVLKNYASSKHNVALHFKRYDDYIYSPVIKERILQADVMDKGHITVYLSHYSDAVVEKALGAIPSVAFHVFSKQRKTVEQKNNITFIPVNNEAFTRSMISSHGVITGAGFETPAETLYLGKKLLCIPILGQYEQLCNAEALKDFNVPVIHSIDQQFAPAVENWLQSEPQLPLRLQHSTTAIVDIVMEKAGYLRSGHRPFSSHGFNFSV